MAGTIWRTKACNLDIEMCKVRHVMARKKKKEKRESLAAEEKNALSLFDKSNSGSNCNQG
jgi:hypothetical protein